MKNSLLKGGRKNENDTQAVLLRMVNLRTERAKLFGLRTHAEFVLQEQTAANAANVHAMLKKLAPAAVKNAEREGEDIQAIMSRETSDKLQSWDWGFYTEKVRSEKYSLDTAAMKPYFELERVLKDGVFFAAQKLYGLTFKERTDLVAYHPEARVFEVFNEDGSAVGLYIGDFYTRDSKRGGAWMNSLVKQSKLLQQKPVVVNNMNVSKPPKGEVTLLSYDETTTLFHEFGHAIHGLLSDVTYPRVSGTAVQRDFVEFPSQVNEMWILWPEVLDNYAIHYQTGERLPQEWVDKLHESSTFNEGHATTSYLAAAVLDLAWHSLDGSREITNVEEFEENAIRDYGLYYPPVPTRYRSTYFSHIFAGGYSAGYYGYIWSEVLDADTVEWFKENGGLTRKNGDHFRNALMSRGGSVDSMEMFRNFRGRDADIEPLLRRRGLIQDA
jgi:peptidyl-dipeptidase Dcp